MMRAQMLFILLTFSCVTASISAGVGDQWEQAAIPPEWAAALAKRFEMIARAPALELRVGQAFAALRQCLEQTTLAEPEHAALSLHFATGVQALLRTEISRLQQSLRALEYSTSNAGQAVMQTETQIGVLQGLLQAVCQLQLGDQVGIARSAEQVAALTDSFQGSLSHVVYEKATQVSGKVNTTAMGSRATVGTAKDGIVTKAVIATAACVVVSAAVATTIIALKPSSTAPSVDDLLIFSAATSSDEASAPEDAAAPSAALASVALPSQQGSTQSPVKHEASSEQALTQQSTAHTSRSDTAANSNKVISRLRADIDTAVTAATTLSSATSVAAHASTAKEVQSPLVTNAKKKDTAVTAVTQEPVEKPATVAAVATEELERDAAPVQDEPMGVDQQTARQQVKRQDDEQKGDQVETSTSTRFITDETGNKVPLSADTLGSTVVLVHKADKDSIDAQVRKAQGTKGLAGKTDKGKLLLDGANKARGMVSTVV